MEGGGYHLTLFIIHPLPSRVSHFPSTRQLTLISYLLVAFASLMTPHDLATDVSHRGEEGQKTLLPHVCEHVELDLELHPTQPSDGSGPVYTNTNLLKTPDGELIIDRGRYHFDNKHVWAYDPYKVYYGRDDLTEDADGKTINHAHVIVSDYATGPDGKSTGEPKMPAEIWYMPLTENAKGDLEGTGLYADQGSMQVQTAYSVGNGVGLVADAMEAASGVPDTEKARTEPGVGVEPPSKTNAHEALHVRHLLRTDGTGTQSVIAGLGERRDWDPLTGNWRAWVVRPLAKTDGEAST